MITGESNFDEKNVQLIRGSFLKKKLLKKSVLSIAKVLDCIKSAEYFMDFATNRSAMLPQIFWKYPFIIASQIISCPKFYFLFLIKVKLVKWQHLWIRNKQVKQSAILGWYLYVKSGWNIKKNIFCCPVDERNNGKKIGWLTNNWKFGIRDSLIIPQLLENSQLTLMEEWRGWCATFTLWGYYCSPNLSIHQNS